jgi:CheY-like chemotaxis protein
VRGDDLVIGTSAAFTGPSRGLGIELYRGSMAYFEHVNRSGGVHGRKIVVKTYDDNYNPIPAIDNTRKLIEQDKVFLLFGYVGTPTVTRVLPLLKKHSEKAPYLFFPFKEAADADAARTDSRLLRILLAEDNPVNQRLALRLLEKEGHTVVLATNGKEALAAVMRESFDVVLMDVQMPEMDGLEATAAIRLWERDTGRHQGIIAMTAHAMKGDRDRCLEAGMDGYVSKPIQIKELWKAIEEVFPAPGPAPHGVER